MMRKRFVAPGELVRQAEEFARLDHRTFSELVCEALHQHMTRFAKKAQNRSKEDLAGRVSDLEEIVRQKYAQVHSGRVSRQG
jgi:phosphoenolpyruvate-protein kinase (PTS system EI component)